MNLSKQLYTIILFIFTIIFIGNFTISINNFKAYLEIESKTKAQDTATLLGMNLKGLIQDKTDPEITSTINAIANRGFYKEIRLEDIEFNINKHDLLESHKSYTNYNIKNLTIDKKDGKIIDSSDELDLENELLELEGIEKENTQSDTIKYSFIPSSDFPNGKLLNISFTAYNDKKKINLTSSLLINKVLVKVAKNEKFDSVPQWFIDLIHIQSEESKSEISDGWKTAAIIYVSSNAGDAYHKLYLQAKNILYYSIVAFIISFLILILFLRFILKPLKDIENLAKDISEGNFRKIEEIPFTTELKNVSYSMNNMSEKIANIINKLNKNLEQSTKKLSQDELTGLQIEQSFRSDMEQIFTDKDKGYILNIKIDNLIEFAKQNTNATVDKFIQDFAISLQKCDKNSIAYRFYGSTFTIILKNTDKSKLSAVVNNLKTAFDNLSKIYDKTCVAHIGIVPFDTLSDTDDLISLANEAYELAKQIGHNEAYINNNSDVRDTIQWRDLIFDIIDNNKFNIEYINQTFDLKNNSKPILKEAFTTAIDENNKKIPIGTFISLAEEYNKITDLDKAVIISVINYIKSNNIDYEILINLSFDSIVDIKFKQWLENILKLNEDIAKQLIFSMTAYGCTRDINAFKKFINIIHKNNAKIIIKRFDIKFISLDNLKKFNLDYIRLSRENTSDIVNDITKQTFIESICEISQLLNIKILAENVTNQKDIEILEKIGIFGISR